MIANEVILPFSSPQMTASEDLRWRAIALYCFLCMDSEQVGVLLGVCGSSVRGWAGIITRTISSYNTLWVLLLMTDIFSYFSSWTSEIQSSFSKNRIRQEKATHRQI